MHIRLARKDDCTDIAKVYVNTWRASYAGTLPDHILVGMDPEKLMITFSRILSKSKEVLLVAEDEKSGIIGMGSAGSNRVQNQDYVGEVYTLYVHPDFQNIGVGKLLLSRLFNELTKCKIYSALIWVLGVNPSRFFYEAMGGKLIGARNEKLWNLTLREYSYGWTNLSNYDCHQKPDLKQS